MQCCRSNFEFWCPKGVPKYMNWTYTCPVHVVDAPKIDENEDSEVVEFIDYITCAFPDVTKYPETSSLFKKVQKHHHTSTCEKGVVCRFKPPWAPSSKTRIVHSKEKVGGATVKQSKKLIDKVLSYTFTISDLSVVTLS